MRAILASVRYLLIAMYFSFWPAMAIGLLVHLIESEWEVIAFGAVFSYVLTEFISRRKGNWFF